MALTPTDVCAAFVVAGYGPPCTIAGATATPVAKPFQTTRPTCSRSAARSAPAIIDSCASACTDAASDPRISAAASSSWSVDVFGGELRMLQEGVEVGDEDARGGGEAVVLAPRTLGAHDDAGHRARRADLFPESFRDPPVEEGARLSLGEQRADLVQEGFRILDPGIQRVAAVILFQVRK